VEASIIIKLDAISTLAIVVTFLEVLYNKRCKRLDYYSRIIVLVY